MKTIQEHLKELDTERLINSYLALKPVCREMAEAMATSKGNNLAKDLWMNYRCFIQCYIEHMREIPIVPDKKAAVLYVFEGVSTTETKKRRHGLVRISELKEKGVEAKDYSYVLCPHGEVAGFFVADTKRTQEDLLGLMTDVLYEACFFGNTDEEIARALKQMEKEDQEFDDEEDTGDEAACNEIEEEPVLVDSQEETVLKKTEWEIRSKEELELEADFRNASEAYAKFLREKALREVAVSLFGESQQGKRKI